MNIVKFEGEWGDFSFHVESGSIISVKDISLSVSIETEDKTAKKTKEKYVSKKNRNPAEITMTGIFSKLLGVDDVRAKSWELMNTIRLGRKGYLYMGDSKLIAPMVMGTNAKIGKLEIDPGGSWSYCEVSITFKQCSKYGDGSSGKKKKRKSGKKGSKKSSKKSSKYGTGSLTLDKSERKMQLKKAKENAKQAAKSTQKNAAQASASIKNKAKNTKNKIWQG